MGSFGTVAPDRLRPRHYTAGAKKSDMVLEWVDNKHEHARGTGLRRESYNRPRAIPLEL